MPAGRETILVTGGAGRLGKALVGRLIKEKKSVRILLQRKEDAIAVAMGAVPYVGDITDEEALEKAMKGVDIVIHLAAVVSQYRLGPHEIIRTNTLGTRKVARAAKAAGVKRILFASTTNVYGRSRRETLTEESETRPSDTYGQSKKLAEQELVDSGVNYTIFRMATIYGPGFENSFFKIFKVIKEGKAHIIGNGKNHLSLVHIDDVVDAYMLALGRKASVNQVYNITDGRDYTQEYLFDLAADLLGVPRPKSHIHPVVVHIVAKARGLDTDEIRFITSNRQVDISKARKELGFKPKESVESSGSYLIKKFESSRKSEG